MGSLMYERHEDNLDTIRYVLRQTTNPVDWPTFATEIEVFQRLHEDFDDVSMSQFLKVGMVRRTH